MEKVCFIFPRTKCCKIDKHDILVEHISLWSDCDIILENK